MVVWRRRCSALPPITWAGATATARRSSTPAARPSGRRSRCWPRRPSAAPRPSAVPGAVALELVHNFSLIHDDLMDGDRERRHRPTVWALFGVRRGDPDGDALAALAYAGAAGGRRRAGQRAGRELTARRRRDDPRAGRGPLLRVAARRHRAGGRRDERPQDGRAMLAAPARSGPSWAAERTRRSTPSARTGATSASRSRRSTTCSASGASPSHREAGGRRPAAAQEDAAGGARARGAGPEAGELASSCRDGELRRRGSTGRLEIARRCGEPGVRLRPPSTTCRSPWPRWRAPASWPGPAGELRELALFVVGRDF